MYYGMSSDGLITYNFNYCPNTGAAEQARKTRQLPDQYLASYLKHCFVSCKLLMTYANIITRG